MIGRSFRINILIRITALAITGAATGWVFATGAPLHSLILVSFLMIGAAISLAWYINIINRKINYFFESVINDDHTLVFPRNTDDRIVNKLGENLERINEHLKNIRVENLRQEQYFSALIEHVGTGILTFNTGGFIIHANSSLKKLLGMKQFTHVRQLEKIDVKLASAVRQMRSEDEKLITIAAHQGPLTLLVRSTAFKSVDQPLTLLTVQDIRKELDEKELDSWLKLIRVLTHEIMNSIAPVTSLSESLCNHYIKDGQTIPLEEVTELTVQNTIRGLKVINEQGRGLIRFVESYRKLTRLPEPVLSEVNACDLVENTIMLYRQELEGKNIRVEVSISEENIRLNIDEKLISQVLINLLKNSADALEGREDAEIQIGCHLNKKGQAELLVTDNGPGIQPELIDEIFIPFFTTRQNGTGIGLSLSRQIMRLHNGSLKVRSIPGRETVFTMTFG
jgi:two-component system, NtrC family, nitrogen regulation sensor histidine kinase NtrY